MSLRIHHFDLKKTYTNVSDAVVDASMDWDVKQGKLLDEDTQQPVPSVFNIKRIEKDPTSSLHNLSLGIMTDKYVPVPNTKLFNPFNSFLESGAVRPVSMGELKQGRVLYMQGQIVGTEELSVGNDGQDKIAPYLVCYNSHDGTRSFGIGHNQVRIVCQNTLMMAMKRGALARYVHRKGILEKVDNVVDIIKKVTDEWQASLDIAAQLRDSKLNANGLEEYVRKFMGVSPTDKLTHRTKGQFDKIMTAATDSPGNDKNDVSLWSAYNAVTHYNTHTFGRADNRIYNNLFGEAAQDNFDAWKLAVETAGLQLAV